MKSFAMTKLIRPHPGKVKIQVSIMSRTTLKLIAEDASPHRRHDGAGLGMGGGNGNAEHGGKQDADGSGEICREA